MAPDFGCSALLFVLLSACTYVCLSACVCLCVHTHRVMTAPTTRSRADKMTNDVMTSPCLTTTNLSCPRNRWTSVRHNQATLFPALNLQTLASLCLTDEGRAVVTAAVTRKVTMRPAAARPEPLAAGRGQPQQDTADGERMPRTRCVAVLLGLLPFMPLLLTVLLCPRECNLY